MGPHVYPLWDQTRVPCMAAYSDCWQQPARCCLTIFWDTRFTETQNVSPEHVRKLMDLHMTRKGVEKWWLVGWLVGEGPEAKASYVREATNMEPP